MRWFPGSNAVTYCARSDEHDSTGTEDETSGGIKAQTEKRMRKLQTLRAELPEPRLAVASYYERGTAWIEEGHEIELLDLDDHSITLGAVRRRLAQ
jgi:2-oxoglutarate/2-oxoacid ferredoxin oxidoreductase subunit alpha